MTPTKLSAEEVKRIEKDAIAYALKAMGSHSNDEEARQQCAMNYVDGATAEALRALERKEELKQLINKEISWLKLNTRVPGSIDTYEHGFSDGFKNGLYMLKRYSEHSQKQTEGEGE